MGPIRALVLVVLAFVLAACASRHGVSAGARIGVSAEELAETGPFRVVYAGPKGEVVEPHEVTLAFSRPVRAATPATVVRTHDGASVEGAWHWFDDRTAVFLPKEPLPFATTYRVTVDERLRSVDGSVLAAIAPFELATPPTALKDATYELDEATGKHFVKLELTRPAKDIAEAIRIEGTAAGGKRETVRFVVLPEDRLEVDPRVGRLEDVEVIAAAGLASAEGPARSAAEKRVKLTGVGPLKAELRCASVAGDEPKPIGKDGGKCAIDSAGVELFFTKPVRPADVARLLSLDGKKVDKSFLDSSSADTIDTVYLESAFESVTAGRKYRLVLAAGIVSQDKDRIATEQVFEFETAPTQPSLDWADIRYREEVVESTQTSIPIAVESVNVGALEIARAPLDEARLLDALATPRDLRWVRDLPGGSAARLVPAAKPNEVAKSSLQLATPSPGFFAVGYGGAKGLQDDVRVLNVTDLGIAAKWSPHGGHVWVTRLSTGAPVPAARVSLRRVIGGGSSEVTTLDTDATGIARIPSAVASTFLRLPSDTERPEAIVFVTHGKDTAFARLPELDPSLARSTGNLIAERLLYRPGESMHIKGYFRTPTGRGLLTPAGKTVTVEAVDGEERAFFSAQVTLDAFGAFSIAIPIPKTVRMGRAQVRARAGEPIASDRRRHEWPARTDVSINEFRAVEIEVKAALDADRYNSGDRAIARARGTYLSGGILGGAKVDVVATLRPDRWAPASLSDYTTDASTIETSKDGLWPKTLFAGDLRLDTSGRLELPIPLPPIEDAMPRALEVEVSVEDVTKTFSYADQATSRVHVRDTYLGLRSSPGGSYYPGAKVRAEVMATNVDGTSRPVAVAIELFRRERFDGPLLATNRKCTVQATPGGCDFTLGEAGYWVFKATAVDAARRPLVVAHQVVVQQPAPPSKPAPAAAPMLPFAEQCAQPVPDDEWRALAVEKDELEVGGAPVRLCLRARKETVASLFTYEREGVVREELLTLGKTGKLVEIPATDEIAPGMSFVLHGVGAHASNQHGDVEVEVRSKKRLSVGITTAEDQRPGDTFEAKVRVTDETGRATPAQVALWAVDEGVLQLDGRTYQVPAPQETFYRARGSDVRSLDTRDHRFYVKSHRLKAPSIRQGATSAGEGTMFGRSVFRPTAFFLPSVVTGPDGVAVVRAKLPENLTRWKVFAVAATAGDLFGGGQASFRTNKPLMVRPALPRFLRPGDRFDATAVLSSLEARESSLKVSMATAGTLSGSRATTVVLPPNGNLPVTFPVEAGAVGSGKIAFHAEGREGRRDDVVIEEEVRPILAFETRVVANELTGRIEEGLGDLGPARPDVGAFDWRISTTPLAGLAESLRGLVDYPYGCTEQLSSRLVPLVRLRALARELGVSLPPDVDAHVRSALQTLLTHQRTDGGFGFWRGSVRSEPLLTVLALDALLTARANGFVVPDSAQERALLYLDPPKDKEEREADLASDAMLEDVLASAGRPRPARLRALAGDTSLPLFARALVAHALAKVDPPLAKRIVGELVTKASVTTALALFADEPTVSSRRTLSSPERTTAMVLRALVEVEPTHPLVPKVVRGLLSQRREGRWATTQASAWAIRALADARPHFAPRGQPSSAEVLFANAPAGKARFTGAAGGETAVGSIPIGRLLGAPGASVSFVADGDARLFYEGTLRYSRREPPRTGLDHGLHIARRYVKLDSEGAAGFAVGDRVVAEVLITTDVARDLVVVDDPIPAGFEAVNTSFASADRKAFIDEGSRFVIHRELHDDRVVSFFDEMPAGAHRIRYPLRAIAAGRFVAPPARAECMYAPDVYGRTGTTWVDTKP